MTTLDIIYLKDLKNILPYKDYRSICNYCCNNGIEILGNGKTRYVLAVQFKRAQLQEKIHDLKTKYGNAWTEVLKSEMNLCCRLQSALDEIQNGRSNSPLKQRIKPKGQAERKFLLDIQKLLR